MSQEAAKLFMEYFRQNHNATFVCNIDSVINLIKEDYLYNVFKDCKEAQWDKTLELFKEVGSPYWVFDEPEIEIICEGTGCYYLDISDKKRDIFIRISDNKTFYYNDSNDEFTKNINKKNIKEMFYYFKK